MLTGLNWVDCLTYLDDLIVFSSTFEDYLCRLHSVFDRLRETGLKLKPTKCHFACDSVRYLGHVVSTCGVHTDLDKVQAVANFPTPTTLLEVRRFLVLAGYYRRYIDGFAKIAAPPLAQEEWFPCTPQTIAAFFTFKELLVTTPVLAFTLASTFSLSWQCTHAMTFCLRSMTDKTTLLPTPDGL